MFKNNEYQVKDVMELYGITRDTIKYYESIGLIEAKRKNNGYRCFDELNVQKLKKILAFRSLGMTAEEIIRHMNAENAQERQEILFQERQRTEQELLEMHKKLNQIRRLERNVSQNSRFQSDFNEVDGLSLCIDCPYITDQERRTFLVARGFMGVWMPEDDTFRFQKCTMIKDDDLQRECCKKCEKKRFYETVYRYRCFYENEKKLVHILTEEYQKLRMLGYQPLDTVYIQQKTLKKDGKEAMFFDILLPVEPLFSLT